jgi:Tfp pilus assembly protein PilX
MKPLKNSRGVSLIAAIFIIVILAFMGVMFVTLINTGSFTSVNDLQSAQALYVAEGGAENAVILLNTSTIANRITCANVNATLNAKSLGAGQFTVIGAQTYSSAPTTLNGAITSAATTITVFSTAGYAQYGRIMIDRELIDYSGTTVNSFLNAVRGRDGTTAVAHANGAAVGQYQCSVISEGSIPTVAAPTAERTVQEGIQLQEGWAVGAGPTMLRWNGTAWSDVSGALPPSANLTSISMLSYVDGWSVGARSANNNTGWVFLRWNGATWTRTNRTTPNSNALGLNSLFMVSSVDGWAVGGPNGNAFLHWSGGIWTNFGAAVSQLQSVDMIDTNGDGIAEVGWAVGARTANNNNGWVFYSWNGANWTPTSTTSPNSAARGLMSVSLVSPTDGWAVGGPNGSVIVHWSGGVWNNFGSPVAQQLQSVYMLDTNNDGIADDGWAVGATTGGRPTVLRWNIPCLGGAGTNTWNNCTATAIVPAVNLQLNKVYCVDANDCWAVGNGGLILHWDGSTWSQIQAGLTAQNLQNVHVIGPEQRPQAAWQEFNP